MDIPTYHGDCKLLRYVKAHQPVTSQDINTHYKNKEGEIYRFSLLLKQGYITPVGKQLDELNSLRYTEPYIVSQKGQNYYNDCIQHITLYWLPIIIDFVLSFAAIVISLLK